jgi:DNA-binding FadR family transcriptional regulator
MSRRLGSGTVDATLQADAVYSRLRWAILSGALEPGKDLPVAEKLARKMLVGAESVADAIGRLRSQRLIELLPDDRLRVLNWRETGGIELVADMLALAEHRATPDVVRSLLETRRALGIECAGLCAARATPYLLRELDQCLDSGSAHAEDRERLDGYLELWRLIIFGADNLVYRFAFTTVARVVDARGESAATLLRQETGNRSAQQALVDAIAGRRRHEAERVADALLTTVLEGFLHTSGRGVRGPAPT